MPQDPIGCGQNMVYTYNNYEVLGCSKHKQESCFEIRDINALDARIKTAMQQMKHERAKKPHRYAWRHVATRRSLCVIGYESSGKTWSYLPWLCHSALKHFDKGEPGACCIILSTDARHGEQIAAWCEKLMDKKGAAVLRLFKQDKIQTIVGKLKENCGILLTSVELLLLLVKEEESVVMNSKLIRCVAFENINALWNQGKKDCERLVDWLFEHLSIGENGTQLLISGRQWCETIMNRLMPKLNDVLLLFTDALEATVYGHIKHELLLIDPQLCEVEILKVLLAKNLEDERVVMACASNNDANGLKIHLMSAGIKSIIVNENNQKNIYKNWCHEDKRNVLIAVDDMIPKLRGNRIDCLFHYTPANSWRSFKTRFNLFYGNYQAQADQCKSEATSIICITQKDADLVWCMCNFLLKHEISGPSAWLTAFHELRITAERLNHDLPKKVMCPQMLSYGNCYVRNCQYSHEVDPMEQPRSVKCFDKLQIEFYIAYIHSPTHFAVKDTSLPIAHLSGGIPITKLEESINVHYIDVINRCQHRDPKPNDICVVQLFHRYQRVVVTSVERDQIEVRQLDNVVGVHHVKATELFVCQEHFIHEPVQCQELCLTGIMPSNTERLWPDEEKKLVLNGFFRERQTNRLCVFKADVQFSFDDKYFVRNIYDSRGNDLKSFMLNNISVLKDEDVLTRLQKLFK
ncbi:hypothetical protein KR044_002144 [Drosophila immigrans]|nr:hypothetical protein KR044_002144 [Drosophila immigrans]